MHKRKLLSIFFAICLLLAIAGVGFFIGLLKYYTIDFSCLEKSSQELPTRVYDDSGELLYTFAYKKSEPIEFEQLPTHVVQAFVAAEDWQFFDHCGISFRGIIRSFLVNMYQRRAVQGASTITQQLLKLIYFSHEKKLSRKIKEQFYALLMERHYTKEHIFQLYLNNVYFGSGIYGIKAASRAFWNCEVSDLTVDQAALLAGVIRSPGNYSPLLFPLSSAHRRNIVLGQMKKLNFITQEEYETYTHTDIQLNQPCEEQVGLYVKEYVRTTLEKMYDKDKVYGGGLKVTLSINKRTQEAAEKSFSERVKLLRKKLQPDLNGGMISMSVSTGAIKALVGGYSFHESQFNRALHARRQQGSVFKPVLYACALENGIDLFSLAVDEPLSIDQNGTLWEPRNFDRRHHGMMTLARGLIHSNNIIAVKLIIILGAHKVQEFARRFHLSEPIYPYLSLSLGCIDSTVSHVAAMFNVFANNGIYVEPFIIESIQDKDGIILYQHAHIEEQVTTPIIAHKISSILSCGLERRRRQAKTWIDSQSFGKTGTTNDSRTCWFAGSTPELTTVLYIGADDNTPMGDTIYPTYTSYPIWFDFHKKIPTLQKIFHYDSSLIPISINFKTGRLEPLGSDTEVFSVLY